MNTQIIRPPAFQRPSGYMYLSASQLNLVDTVATLVALNAIGGGFTDGIEDTVTHRITPGKAGRYSVVGIVQFENVIADKSYQAELRVSGSIVMRDKRHSSLTDKMSARCILPCIRLSETDYLELWATSNAGVDTVDIDNLYTNLMVQRVR
jgi:hypothetical protein